MAHPFRPGEKLITQSTPDSGEVGVDFYLRCDAAPNELGTLFPTQQNIRTCHANPSASRRRSSRFMSSPPTPAFTRAAQRRCRCRRAVLRQHALGRAAHGGRLGHGDSRRRRRALEL